ncbi:MAG: hypothetical protein QOK36_4415, partial [Gaiellales bacterium]|nr:hypothetical protein [Gaiellales bacterium]
MGIVLDGLEILDEEECFALVRGV